jgi:hypothetical protein
MWVAEGGRLWPEGIVMADEVRDAVDRRWEEYGLDRTGAGNGRISKVLRQTLRR